MMQTPREGPPQKQTNLPVIVQASKQTTGRIASIDQATRSFSITL
jgi:hypothetical protein